MRIFVCGTRGIPNILGGVETHCEALYPRLKKQGVNITIARRSAYITGENTISEYEGIQLADIHSPKKKSLEAIIHSFLAVLYAKRKGFNYIHIHAIGPALVIPFARLLGMKVVMTHHGPDYDRQKWGKLAKASLKLGEWCAAKFANEIIVISQTINKILKEKYKRHDAHLIHNGVVIPTPAERTDYIESLKLERQKYIIAVGRFVPEKGWHDLLEAAEQINPEYKLVFVGDADHPSPYSEQIKQKAKEKGVVLTGFIKGEKLHQIFSHAALFVMPSYHEGLPIALLEALSYNLKVVVSNIPANKEVPIGEQSFFQVGNIEELSQKINSELASDKSLNYQALLHIHYNWDQIADQTLDVYRMLMNKEKITK